ncbi:MAG: hypothetical protein IPK28_11030 [Devosia sp.]|nr:hypothetical protein [Devosia sp.]
MSEALASAARVHSARRSDNPATELISEPPFEGRARALPFVCLAACVGNRASPERWQHGQQVGGAEFGVDAVVGNPYAEDDAGLGFYLDVAPRRALVFGKAVDIVLGEADVVEVAGRQLRHRRLDIALGQPELGR